MESAKQNLQVIDISSEVRGRKEADIPPKTFAGLKIHAPGKGNLLSDPPRPSQTENQKNEDSHRCLQRDGRQDDTGDFR